LTAHPRTAEAPDTRRRHIESLGRRAAAYPNLSADVEDELALVSAITDPAARERAFGELVGAYRRREHDVAETVLDLLTGRLR
jgi:hypothetical protein